MEGYKIPENTPENSEILENLEGQEGNIFPNSIFTKVTNKKGQTYYKSSSKDRKIVYLSELSEHPESETPYKVLIIEDSDPQNPNEGKLTGVIVNDELSFEEAVKKAQELKALHNSKKPSQENVVVSNLNEKLTDVDRERFSEIIENIINKNINLLQYLEYPSLENHRNEAQNKIVLEVRKNSEEALEYRRIIRDEGSKLLSFVNEKIKEKGNERNIKRVYSQIISLAADENDAKKVLNFYSSPEIMKDGPYLMAEYGLETLTRIIVSKDLDLVTEYYDKAIKGTKGIDNIADQTLYVMWMLNMLKSETTDNVEISKINKAIDYVKNRTTKMGSYIPYGSEAVNTKKELKRLHDNLFIDLEIRNAVEGFSNFSFIYADKEQIIEEITKLFNVLKKKSALVKMQELLNNFFADFTEGDNELNLDDVKFLLKEVKDITGMEPDLSSKKEMILDNYTRWLLDDPDTYQLEYAQILYEVCKIKPEFSEDLLSRKYLEMITHSYFDSSIISKIAEFIGTNFINEKTRELVQKKYNELIFGKDGEIKYQKRILDRFHPEFRNYANDLGIAKNIFNNTGIKPDIEESKVKKLYIDILSFPYTSLETIETISTITGVNPDYSEYEDVLQIMYTRHLDANSDLSPLKRVVDITKIKPKIDSRNIDKIIIKHLFNGRVDRVKEVEEALDIKIDWNEKKEIIQEEIIRKLMGREAYYIPDILRLCNKITKDLNIEFNLNDNQLDRLSNTCDILIRNGNEHVVELILNTFSNNNLFEKVAMKILVNYIVDSNWDAMGKQIKKIDDLKMSISPKILIDTLKPKILSRPEEIIHTMKSIRKYLSGNEASGSRSFMNGFLEEPWLLAIEKIEKIQAVVQGDNDPWKLKFKPFLDYVFNKGIISINNDEDSHILVSFVDMMGMGNTPKIFEAYVDCSRNKSSENLSVETIRLFEDFGIKVKKKDGTFIYKNSMELFNELSKSRKVFQTELLNDKVPSNIKTPAGVEILGQIRGSSYFERKVRSASDIVRLWEDIGSTKPEVSKLPMGFTERSFKATVLKKKEVVNENKDEKLNEFLSSQEVADTFGPLAESWRVACKKDIADIIPEVIERLKSEEENIQKMLSLSKEEMEAFLQDEKDTKVKDQLTKKYKALQNPKGREAITKQALTITKAREEVENRYNVNSVEEYNSSDYYVDTLELFCKLDKDVPLGKEIRDISASHMFQCLFNELHADVIQSIINNENDLGSKVEANEETIKAVWHLSKDYIEGVYLHHLQDEDFTFHKSFSPQLLEKLNLVWQQQLDKQTGYLPITQLKNKLDVVLGNIGAKSDKEIPVTMVPVSGLLNVFSGDLGGSCHSTYEAETAKGEYPNLRTWVYVTNKGRPNEEIKGSVLSIMAERISDKVPTLIVRANNPEENFIQTLDKDSFVVSMLKEVVEVAKKVREERIKGSKKLPVNMMKQSVVLPMDSRGYASTNRQPVNDSYRKRFVGNTKVELASTADTNFNQYEVWNPRGMTPPVVIWEIDENGKETWYGDWKIVK